MARLLRADGTQLCDVTEVTLEGDIVDLEVRGEVFRLNTVFGMIFEADDGVRSRLEDDTRLQYGYTEVDGQPTARIRGKLIALRHG